MLSDSRRNLRRSRRGEERQREQKIDSISATSAPLPLCGKPNILRLTMPEMNFGNRYKRTKIYFNFLNFVTKLGPTAALSLTQLGRELHKHFSGSPEETHHELGSRFMVGTPWSPKGPGGFWLGSPGPSCFETPAPDAAGVSSKLPQVSRSRLDESFYSNARTRR